MSPPGQSRGPHPRQGRTPRNTSGKDTHAERHGTEQHGVALLISALDVSVARTRHWETRCPCHDDTHASLIIDAKPSKYPPHKMTVLVHCPVCRASLTDVCDAVGVECWRVLEGNEHLRAERPTPSRRPLTDEYVTRCHERLLTQPERLAYVTDVRGLSPSTVEQHRLGYDAVRDRFTLPVFDGSDVVNVRRYLPDAPPNRKMLNTLGYGRPARLYPSLAPSGPVLVCEGEWDALVAGQHLAQHGYTVVTSTHGAATFLPEWVPLFAGRHVAFLYDCDDAGRTNAAKHAAMVAPVAGRLRLVDLDPRRDDGWDVSDWFGERRSAAELRHLIRTTPWWPLGAWAG